MNEPIIDIEAIEKEVSENLLSAEACRRLSSLPDDFKKELLDILDW